MVNLTYKILYLSIFHNRNQRLMFTFSQKGEFRMLQLVGKNNIGSPKMRNNLLIIAKLDVVIALPKVIAFKFLIAIMFTLNLFASFLNLEQSRKEEKNIKFKNFPGSNRVMPIISYKLILHFGCTNIIFADCIKFFGQLYKYSMFFFMVLKIFVHLTH